MTDNGQIGRGGEGGDANNRGKRESTGPHLPGGEGGGVISQTQSPFVRERDILSAGIDDCATPLDQHYQHDDAISSTGSDDRRRLMMEPPAAPPLAAMGDKAWAVAFTLNVVCTLFSAIYFLPSALSVVRPTLKTRGWKSSDVVPWTFITISFAGSAAATLSLVVFMLSRHIHRLKIALGVYVLVLVAALRILPDGFVGPVGGTLPVIFGVLACCLSRPNRVNFSAAIIQVARPCVMFAPKMFGWAFCANVARYTWLAVGVFACVGSIAAFKPVALDGDTQCEIGCEGPWVLTALSWECWEGMVPKCNDNGTTAFLMGFWIASVSWSSGVAANVIAATVSDVVAAAWSSQDNVNTAWDSCHRVLHSSLGSLCKVAALDGLARPLRFAIGRLSHAFWVADGLMLLVQFTASYVLLQPVVFIGVYRCNFAEAARQARVMFRANGKSLIINDSMVIAGFSFLCAAVAAIPAIFTFFWLLGNLSIATPSPSCVSIVFFCGVVAMFATLEVLLYAVKAVFVCFVQPPEGLAENRDGWPYLLLHKSWRELQSLHAPILENRGEEDEI